MAKYRFKAKKGPDEIIEETIVAENESAVLNEISKRGYYPISIELADKKHSSREIFRGPSKRVKIGDLAVFSRQLSDLLGAGLPLYRALSILEEQTSHPVLKNVLLYIREDIREGQSLTEAIRKQKKYFPPLFVNMIHAGEVGGFLESVLDDLASFCEKEQEVREKIKSALVYPCLMAVVGILSIVVMMTLVIPKLMVMFDETGQKLPLVTQVLIDISSYMQNYWWHVLIAVVVVVLVFKRVTHTEEGRLARDRIKLQLPIFGDLIQKTELSRFTRTLGALLKNGVPMLQSLEVVVDNISNHVLKVELKKASEEIKRGGNLGSVLKQNRFFPPLLTNMLVVGEESGTIEQALNKVSITYDREVDRAVKNFTALLEPIMILTMGSLVLFIVVAMMLPIFQMNSMLG